MVVDNHIYDPSYGTDFDTLDAWQAGSIAGWYYVDKQTTSLVDAQGNKIADNVVVFRVRSAADNPGELNLKYL